MALEVSFGVKLLLDENLSHRLVAKWADKFPGSVHVDEIGLRGQPISASSAYITASLPKLFCWALAIRGPSASLN